MQSFCLRISRRVGIGKAVAPLLVCMSLVTACGGGTDNAADTNATPTITSDSTADGEPILINTHVNFSGSIPEGEVLDGSTIGDSPFCPGGTFRDLHGNDDIGLVDRTFRCPTGTMRVGFTPGEPQGDTQAGPWKIIGGTGAFKRMRGQGRMEARESGNDEGRETFTGTVTR